MSIKLEDLTLTNLRKLCKAYKDKVVIPRYTKKTREELLEILPRYFSIENNQIKVIAPQPFPVPKLGKNVKIERFLGLPEDIRKYQEEIGNTDESIIFHPPKNRNKIKIK